ncbi:nucleotidyl transferase AbiEii/AbiGii toxin family protein [Campylobacter hominis]|uniref:nucleotidyl transferase AbiEii/AbiGii toxin family protein n=1 Tax=Campylobacter hominis TaxID=76517 RepID=UPI00248B2C57|nr:nucleotidyl transferase AbiEii/AbiGii toxin family protein [Campylobacter hominis]
MLKEYQEKHIKFIKELLPLFGDNFILKGGTALNLYYGLNRYSEDIDLDIKNQTNMNFINKLKKHNNYNCWNIFIKKNTPTTFKIMIDYGNKSDFGTYPLKIEVSSRNLKLLEKNLLKYKNINGVNIYDVTELIKMKATAFSGRDKIRDFFDLAFLFKNYKKFFNETILMQIYEKIQYAGIDELNSLLKDEVKKKNLNESINFNTFSQDFLFDIEYELLEKQEKEIGNKIDNKINYQDEE